MSADALQKKSLMLWIHKQEVRRGREPSNCFSVTNMFMPIKLTNSSPNRNKGKQPLDPFFSQH